MAKQIKWNDLQQIEERKWSRKQKWKQKRNEMRKEKYDFVWRNLMWSPKQPVTKGE